MQITLEQAAKAFALWETDYRANVSKYMTPDEVGAAGVDEVSAGRAEYFMALLSEVQQGA